MYQILTIEPDDENVKSAVAAITGGTQDFVPRPTGLFKIITNTNVSTEAEGDSQNCTVIIGAGSAAGVSNCLAWNEFVDQLYELPTADPDEIYVVSWPADASNNLFGYGCFSAGAKAKYSASTVHASNDGVKPISLDGTWITLP